MSDWQDKSDPEINKAVTALQFKCDRWESNGFCFYNNEANGAHNAISINDYCNNVLASWAIIIESKINLVAPNAGAHWRVFVNVRSMGLITGYYSSYDENPLRAAMIVYLEMNGVKPNE